MTGFLFAIATGGGYVERIQRICNARQCNGFGDCRDHRRCVRQIITSLVNDVLMPLIGLALGGINFSEQAIVVGAAVVKWGAFVQSIIDFLIVAFVIFMLVRTLNRFKKPEPVVAPTTKDCPYCFTAIPIEATRCPNCTSQL